MSADTSGQAITWLRDPAGMPRTERVAEIARIFASGLRRLQLVQQNLEMTVDASATSKAPCATAPVNRGAERVAG